MVGRKLTIGAGCQIDSDARLGFEEHGGEIIIGDAVKIRPGCVLRTCTGTIRIGSSVVIGYGVLINGYGDVTIGSDVLISPYVTIYASNHGIARKQLIRLQKSSGLGIHIGNDVWIGASSVITDGVTLNKGCVIGAGAIVTKSVPAYEIWAGNPARKIGERS